MTDSAHVRRRRESARRSRRREPPYFDLGTLDWREAEIDPGGIEFTMAVSQWFALFARHGFTVTNYCEPRPRAAETETRFETPVEWARRFPSEQVWFLTKTP